MNKYYKILILFFIVVIVFLLLLFFLMKYYKQTEYKKQRLYIIFANLIFYLLLSGVIGTIYLVLITFVVYLLGNAKKKSLAYKLAIMLPILFLLVYKIILKENFELLLFGKEIGVFKVIGISFFTLNLISYLIEKGKKECSSMIKEEFLDMFLYISFFPTIVSGPIIKYREFDYSIKKFDFERVNQGIFLVLIGIFKKIVLADRLGYAVNIVYKSPIAYSGLSILLTTFAYTMQLYFDFSGYSDIAIGLGKIIGFEIKENFNMPYLSYSFSEFWKRWHISLSQWLTEYIYIPLGGNRKGTIRTVINTVIVMVVSGFWHGFTISFVLWGVFHALFLIINKYIIKTKKNAISIILIALIVNFLWVPFRVQDINEVLTIFRKIFIMEAGVNYYYTYTIIILLVFLVYNIVSYKFFESKKIIISTSIKNFKGKVLFIFIILSTLMFCYVGETYFIYGNF